MGVFIRQKVKLSELWNYSKSESWDTQTDTTSCQIHSPDISETLAEIFVGPK